MHPPQRGRGVRHDGHRRDRPRQGLGQAVAAEQVDQAALDQSAVPGRVLGLDVQLDALAVRRAPFERELQEPFQGQHGPPLGIGLDLLPGRLQQRVALARLPRGEVQRLEVGQLEGREHTAPVAGAVDPAVVHADQDPVAGQPNVALEGVGTLFQGQLVRTEGVLGVRGRGAPVCHDLHGAGAGHAPTLPGRRRTCQPNRRRTCAGAPLTTSTAGSPARTRRRFAVD